MVAHADEVEEGRDEDEGAAAGGCGAEERGDEGGCEVLEAGVGVRGRRGGIEAREGLSC